MSEISDSIFRRAIGGSKPLDLGPCYTHTFVPDCEYPPGFEGQRGIEFYLDEGGCMCVTLLFDTEENARSAAQGLEESGFAKYWGMTIHLSWEPE